MVPRYESTLLKAWQRAKIPPEAVQESQITRILQPPAHMPVSQPTPVVPPAPVIQQHPSPPPSPVHDQLAPIRAPEAPVGNTHPMRTRGKSGIQRPNTRYALLTTKQPSRIPKNIREAMDHPMWNAAVGEEMIEIHTLHTWSLVPATPDMNLLSSRWVFSEKLNPDGTVRKNRARLVARGCGQEEGINYLETFSPVVRTATIRLLLNIATAKEWPVKQLDVASAFLHGELNEPVFMQQLEGFVDPNKPDYVCRLTKALYGLKQAPRAWFDTFSRFLIEFGFSCSKSDPSLFTYHHNKKTLVLLLYVDDILLIGSDTKLLNELLDALNRRFDMKDLGPPSCFLGIEIEAHSGGMFLHQTRYAQEILQQTSMNECNPVATPLPLRPEYDQSELFMEPTYFRSVAGKLQYLTITRPDIQYAVNFIFQRMHAPTNADFGFLKRILRYIKGTATLGLHLRKDSALQLSAY